MPRFNLPLTAPWTIACCLAVGSPCPFDNELSAQETAQSQRTEKAQGREDLLVADFEGDDYGQWQVEGDVFGAAPARGTLANQQPVSGFKGRGMVNTYLNGDAGQGRLVSPPVVIERRYMNFLIGGGSHPGKTGMNLLVDGQVVRSATGTASTPADDEHLSWHTWDVSELAGKQVQFEIFDRHSEGWGHINVDHVVQSDRRGAPEHPGPDIARAMSSVEGAAARAEADGTRPVYHFRPPALWMNDPNGPIHHGGFYHMFYQHNPYGDRWQHMHWGHARSRDLVHWEHLPIALAPRPESGEEHCFSGCAVQNGKGQIMLLYTSIGPGRRAGDSAQQFAAVATDESLIHWRPHPANPVLDESLHGDVKIYDWRDPFVFHHEGRAYMILGGNLNRAQGGKAVVALYQAENPELSRWRYLGILFTHPDAGVTNIECPNFFQLGGKWLLIVSPHRRVEYFLGSFDAANHKFVPEQQGFMDLGNYYAPNTLRDGAGRWIAWGWVNGFESGRGWNGCLTLPRVLSLGGDGRLHQQPAAELAALRGKRIDVGAVELAEGSRLVPEIEGDTLEIHAEFELKSARAVGLTVRRSADGSRGVSIRFDGSQLEVAGMKGELALAEGETLKLRIFVDKSVTEVYANGHTCLTRVVHGEANDRGLELFSHGGPSRLKSLEAWELSGADVFARHPRKKGPSAVEPEPALSARGRQGFVEDDLTD